MYIIFVTMKYITLLSIILLSSCGMGYYPFNSDPVTVTDIVNHGFHCECEDIEIVSFNLRIVPEVADAPIHRVMGNNIPMYLREYIDTSGVCAGGCTLYLTDIAVIKEGEKVFLKRKYYISVKEE